MCCQNIIDQQINRAYGSTPAAGPPPRPCAFSFGCAKSCDALHRGRLSTAKCLRSNHEFAAGPIFQKEMPSIWMAFLFGAGYGSRTRLLGLGSRCTTDVRILRTKLSYHTLRRFARRKSAAEQKDGGTGKNPPRQAAQGHESRGFFIGWQQKKREGWI